MISFKPAIAGLVLASCAVSQCSAAAGGNVRSRKLSFSSIAGYEPLNIVTDHVSAYRRCCMDCFAVERT